MEFYTNIQRVGNKLWLRYMKDGKDRSAWIDDFCPTLYVKTNEKTNFFSIFEERLKPMPSDGIKHAREMIEQYRGVQGFEMFGNTNWEYSYIFERYGNRLRFDPNQIVPAFVDIETTVGENSTGFPYAFYAKEKITLITHKQRGKYHVFAWRPFDIERFNKIDLDVYMHVYSNEDEMLKAYVEFWSNDYPHAVTGWNIESFDIPYIINRVRQRHGDDLAKKLSPINQITLTFMEDDPTTLKSLVVRGIEVLDYLPLFKKFSPGERDFKLDAMAQDFLNEAKVENPTGDSFRGFYSGEFEVQGSAQNEIQEMGLQRAELKRLILNTPDSAELEAKFIALDAEIKRICWDTFVWYNVRDVDLVYRLDKKLGMLNLAFTLAYLVGMNYSDVHGTCKPWDIFIQNENAKKGIFGTVNDNDEVMPRELMGGFVKLYKAGLYKYGVTLDATSLYPSLMMMFNISPDTIVPEHKIPSDLLEYYDKNHINNFLEFGFPAELTAKLKKHQMCMTMNGIFYRTDKKGFIPEIVEDVFKQRKIEKRTMLDYEVDLEKVETELKACTDPARKKVLEESQFNLETLVSIHHNTQLALKTLMNALYGAMGNEWFRYFNFYNAEGITSSGQFAIQYNTRHINSYINKVVKSEENTINVVYNDTDSISVSLQSVIEKTGVDTTNPGFVDVLCKFADTALNNQTAVACQEIADNLNVFDNKLSFKREKVFLSGLYVKKKRYALLVIDDEGVRFSEPKIKITGLETKRSDTPVICREALKECINLILTKDSDIVGNFVSEFEKKFYKMSPEEYATPTGVTKINKYIEPNGKFAKGTQAHIRAAHTHNEMIKKLKLDNDVELIEEGDKLKMLYLRMPNPVFSNVIGFKGKIPTEFGIEPYVDTETMYNDGFYKAAERMISAAGWNINGSFDIEDMFG